MWFIKYESIGRNNLKWFPKSFQINLSASSVLLPESEIEVGRFTKKYHQTLFTTFRPFIRLSHLVREGKSRFFGTESEKRRVMISTKWIGRSYLLGSMGKNQIFKSCADVRSLSHALQAHQQGGHLGIWTWKCTAFLILGALYFRGVWDIISRRKSTLRSIHLFLSIDILLRKRYSVGTCPERASFVVR